MSYPQAETGASIYSYRMGMPLKLDEETAAALTARAEAEGRSFDELGLEALRSGLGLNGKHDPDAMFDEVAAEDAELLDRLAR